MGSAMMQRAMPLAREMDAHYLAHRSIAVLPRCLLSWTFPP
jgi:hypothetical protein